MSAVPSALAAADAPSSLLPPARQMSNKEKKAAKKLKDARRARGEEVSESEEEC